MREGLGIAVLDGLRAAMVERERDVRREVGERALEEGEKVGVDQREGAHRTAVWREARRKC
jgi:hypothetical protein